MVRATRVRKPRSVNWTHIAVAAAVTAIITAVVSPLTALVSGGFGVLWAGESTNRLVVYKRSRVLLPDERFTLAYANSSTVGNMLQYGASADELDAEQHASPKHFYLLDIAKSPTTFEFNYKSASSLNGYGHFTGRANSTPGVFIGTLRGWAHDNASFTCKYSTYLAVVIEPKFEPLLPRILKEYFAADPTRSIIPDEDVTGGHLPFSCQNRIAGAGR